MNKEWMAYPLLPIGVTLLIAGGGMLADGKPTGAAGLAAGLFLTVLSYLLARSGMRAARAAERDTLPEPEPEEAPAE